MVATSPEPTAALERRFVCLSENLCPPQPLILISRVFAALRSYEGTLIQHASRCVSLKPSFPVHLTHISRHPHNCHTWTLVMGLLDSLLFDSGFELHLKMIKRPLYLMWSGCAGCGTYCRSELKEISTAQSRPHYYRWHLELITWVSKGSCFMIHEYHGTRGVGVRQRG